MCTERGSERESKLSMRSVRRDWVTARKLVVPLKLLNFECVDAVAGSYQSSMWCAAARAYNFWLLLVKFNLNLTFDVLCTHSHTPHHSLTLLAFKPRLSVVCSVERKCINEGTKESNTHSHMHSQRTRVVSSINKSAFINNEACSTCSNNNYTKSQVPLCVCEREWVCVELSALYQFWHFKLRGCAFNLTPATAVSPSPVAY